MKPAPFVYEAPRSLDEALRLLAEHGDEARVLAGGQSLVPAMSMRVERPAVVVDINRIPGLATIDLSGGRLRVGPLARHRAFESPPLGGPVGNLIGRAAHLIAHPPIRARGTMLGSLAFADPAAEWCVVTQLLDGEVTAASVRGTRTMPVEQLLRSAFSNSLADDEMLLEATLTLPAETLGAAIVEQSHTDGDFAVAVAAALIVEEEGVRRYRVAVGGVAPAARRLRRLEAELDAGAIETTDTTSIADLIRDDLDPPSDPYGSAAYRAHLACVLTSRALREASA